MNPNRLEELYEIAEYIGLIDWLVTELAPPPPLDYGNDYWKARQEHAWLLRAEGLPFSGIGARLDITRTRARDLVLIFGRRYVSRAIRHARWSCHAR